MKSLLITLFAVYVCRGEMFAQNPSIVRDRNFDFVHMIEGAWRQPSADNNSVVRIIALRVGSEAANPLTVFLYSSVGLGADAKTSLWNTGIRCFEISAVAFSPNANEAVVSVAADVFRDDGKPLREVTTRHRITWKSASSLSAEKSTAPIVKQIGAK
jgi:hypothetical protein